MALNSSPGRAAFAAPSQAPAPPSPSGLSLAGIGGQMAVGVLLVGTVAAVAWQLDANRLIFGMAAALTLGIVVGVAVPPRAGKTRLPGSLLLLCTMVGVSVLLGLAGATSIAVTLAVGQLAGVFAFGLDWHYVERLRGVALWSGLLVLVVLRVGGTTSALVVGLVWLAMVAGALAALEQDRRSTLGRPEPTGPSGHEPNHAATTRGDLAIIVLGCIGAAILAALALSVLADVLRSTSDGPEFDASEPFQLDVTQGSGAPDPGRSNAGHDPLDRPLPGVDGERFDLGEAGSGVITTLDGSSYVAIGTATGGVVLDAVGNIVATFDGGDITTLGADGREMDFELDEAGTLSFEGSDGVRYELRQGEGETLEVIAPNGEQVGALRPSGQDSYLADPQASSVVPFEDGNVPLPPSEVRESAFGEGSPTGPGSFGAGDGAGGWPGPGGAPGPGAGGTSTDSDLSAPTQESATDDTQSAEVDLVLVAVGLVLAALVVVAGVVLWRRRVVDEDAPTVEADIPASRAWADSVLDRLEAEGRLRGNPRQRGETVVDFTEALRAGPLPDDRLVDVAASLCAAYFGPRQPDEAERARVSGLVDEIVRDHPHENPTSTAAILTR